MNLFLVVSIICISNKSNSSSVWVCNKMFSYTVFVKLRNQTTARNNNLLIFAIL